MKNKFIWLPVALIAVVVVGAAVWFGNTQTQKGALVPSLVQPTSMPDLAVKMSKTSYTVTNIGNAPVKSFSIHTITIAAVQGNNCNNGLCTAYSHDITSGPIMSGQSMAFSNANDSSISALVVAVDPLNEVAESNEANNIVIWLNNNATPTPSVSQPVVPLL
ncbi:hypothetical protein HZA42_02285 [Candidatus Peregrinibacteria bacterium]|nr:hypothetical protein [Candidatus Peregrinibacteria bacterium]